MSTMTAVRYLLEMYESAAFCAVALLVIFEHLRGYPNIKKALKEVLDEV